jgi:branched-chain amino acid transport system substrate-binding protein
VPVYLFLACFGDNTQAAAGAQYAHAALGARSAYLLFDETTDYTVLLAQYFRESFTALGGAIVLEDDYDGHEGARDLSAQLVRLLALGSLPDILYISAGPDEVGLVVQQVRGAGIGVPILGGDGYDTPLLVEIAGTAADDVYYTTHALLTADSPNPRVRRFVADYDARFGTPPESAFAGLGYDTVQLLADAIRRAGSDERAGLLASLAATDGFAGVTGTITYGAGARIPTKTVTVVRVAGGEIELAAEIVPDDVPPAAPGATAAVSE